MVKTGSAATRQRLVDVTLDLVAAQGFDGVSVGDIETAAGLAPRSGALYKYFDSKLAVLEAGLEQHLDSIAGIELDLGTADRVDIRAELTFVARWLLEELDRERTITHVIEREGDRLPELRNRMRAGVSDRGYRITAAFIDRWTGTVAPSLDREALAVVVLGSLINLRRSTWTFGRPPLDVDDDRAVETFVEMALVLFAAADAADPSD